MPDGYGSREGYTEQSLISAFEPETGRGIERILAWLFS